MSQRIDVADEGSDKILLGARVATVEVKLMQETLDEMNVILARNGWEPEKGLRILLCQGLGYAKGLLALHSSDKERETLALRLARNESMYAVMKYDVFHVTRDNQTLGMRDAALSNSDKLHRQTIMRLWGEQEQAQERIRHLTAEVERLNQECRRATAPEPMAPWYRKARAKTASWCHRLLAKHRPA